MINESTDNDREGTATLTFSIKVDQIQAQKNFQISI